MLKDLNFRACASAAMRLGRFRLICLAIAGMAAWSGAIILAARSSEDSSSAAVEHHDPIPPITRAQDAVETFGQLPGVLREADSEAYRAAFSLQRRGQWKAADTVLSDVTDERLMGVLRGERYLSRKYASTYPELLAWLNAYSDLPSAAAVYALALNKKPADIWLRMESPRRAKLSGYGEESEALATTLGGNTQWREGLSAWRQKRYDIAASRFVQIASLPQKLPESDRTAVNFWAWRALEKAGDAKAAKYLSAAAQGPRSFYGILARKQLGQPLGLTAAPKKIDRAALIALYQNPAVGRMVALVQAGQRELAEAEMRALFPASSRAVQAQLIAVAAELGLPAVQIRMAQSMEGNGTGYEYALYPRPKISPQEGFAVAPELIFAFARAESGFHANAKSGAGALGLMQIMPETASYIAEREKIDLRAFRDDRDALGFGAPVANVTLGQSYIRYLLGMPGIDGNLFYMAAAYNAGPGKLAEWQKTVSAGGDPLLFLESVPYSETRRYIARVMTAFWIYSELQNTREPTSAMVARGEWPVYALPAADRIAQLSKR